MDFFEEELSGLALEMLGAEDAAFVLAGADGNIISLTAGAARLLRQRTLEPVSEVLSERAAAALQDVLRTGAQAVLEEELDGRFYNLEIRPASSGALLYFSPAESGPSGFPPALYWKMDGSLSHILAALHLASGAGDAKKQALMEDVRRSCLRIYRELLHLRLLEYADAPELLMNFRRTDVAALCRTLVKKCGAVCRTRGLEVRLEIEAPKTCKVVCDRTMIARAVLELLMNAVRARGTSWVRLRVSHAAGRVHVTVADDGCGVPPEELERLYHGWARGQDESSLLEQHAAGLPSGLGLPVTRRIAGWHGGTLLQENGPEGGAVFRLSWPDDLMEGGTQLHQMVMETGLDPVEIELSVL